MREFRFGVNIGYEGLLECARRVEELGFDVLLASDHLGAPAPFPLLAAAAAVTERVRLGTYVINVPFWNSSLLAREFATIDVISGGRVEVGLGSGHMKSEFVAAGIPWSGFDARADCLAATIEELDRLFSDDGQRPLPVQRPRPPLLVGGTSDRLLRLAAEHADIVAFSGVFQIKGAEPGRFRLATADELDERVAFYRSVAGDRADRAERGLLLQWVQLGDDPRGVAERLRAEYELSASVDELLDSPVLLLGTLEQAIERVHALRDRYGVSYLVAHHRSFDSWSQVVRAIRAS
jgi:probable F420-dependent oxidoreductase